MRRSGLRSTLFRLTVARRRRLSSHSVPAWARGNAPSSRARSPRWMWGAPWMAGPAVGDSTAAGWAAAL